MTDRPPWWELSSSAAVMRIPPHLVKELRPRPLQAATGTFAVTIPGAAEDPVFFLASSCEVTKDGDLWLRGLLLPDEVLPEPARALENPDGCWDLCFADGIWHTAQVFSTGSILKLLGVEK